MKRSLPLLAVFVACACARAEFSCPVPGEILFDAGAPVASCGVRFESVKDLWHARLPHAFSVWACADAQGGGAVKIADVDDLPPAFAGNAAFATWPQAAAARWYKFQVSEPGWKSILSRGTYTDWLDWPVRQHLGIPFDGFGSTNGCQIASIVVFGEKRPVDFPVPNAADVAVPTYRVAFDHARTGGTDAQRKARLQALAKKAPRIVYAKHYTFGGNAEHSGTSGLSDDLTDARPRNWRKGGQLCLITITPEGELKHEVLVDRPEGCVRDPAVSPDGKTVVFAMRENWPADEWHDPKNWQPSFPTHTPWAAYAHVKADDFHLYSLDLETRALKQLTFSRPARCADYEPCFTADGRIVFQSTRCEQIVPCHQTVDANLYVMNADGSGMRRLGFDGGATLYPQELHDGRILYTRYEYNDRSARFNQALFTMNPDGTAQQEYYGNGAVYPTSLFHFRAIPGSDKVIGVVSGHHVHQKGKLAIVDRTRGCQGDAGITFVAGSSPDDEPGVVASHYENDARYNLFGPVRERAADWFGQIGPQWQHPYPLSEDEWLVAFQPEGSLVDKDGANPPFGIYWQNAAGDRELLAWDPTVECLQPVVAAPRARAHARSNGVNLTKSFGVFDVRDVYAGEAMRGVRRGTVKKLRVVAVECRSAFLKKCDMHTPCDAKWKRFVIYGGDWSGEAISAGGVWDVKHVLGEADVAEDGSCAFECPANNGVYFQLLDDKGQCVQTMRSWATLMPGETQSCIGCHENKLQAGPPTGALRNTRVQKLKASSGCPRHPLLARLEKEGITANAANWLGVCAARSSDPDAPVEGFSFPKQIQPILDRSCVRCHNPQRPKRMDLTGEHDKNYKPQAGRAWTKSYVNLTKGGRQTDFLNWYSPTGCSEPLPPYAQGSSQSKLMRYFEPTHAKVQVTDEEKRLVRCWIDLGVPFVGGYAERTILTEDERKIFDWHAAKRAAFAEEELQGLRAEMKK